MINQIYHCLKAFRKLYLHCNRVLQIPGQYAEARLDLKYYLGLVCAILQIPIFF